MQYEETIHWILTSFFKTTQIEALYLDSQMKLSSCQFHPHTNDDFYRLGLREVEPFLKHLFAEGEEELKDSYTYCLRHNFVCNASIIEIDGQRRGAIITQPVLLSTIQKEELKSKYTLWPEEERDALVAAMLRAPVVSLDRIVPIGRTLDLLIKHAFGETEFKHVMCADENNTLSYQLMQGGTLQQQQSEPVPPYRFGGYATYSKLKNAISAGDTEALLDVLHYIGSEHVPMDQLASKDIIRSIKNRLIEACTMARVIAIEAQAPYEKTRDFIEQTIREIEAREDINDLYQLTRAAFVTLTRYVARAQMSGYSKHVRLTKEHIETNFAQELSLESLAKVAGISKFYLSSLIKKETGLSITDMINRVRVEEGKRLLAESTMGLAELSTSVGFTNSNYFSKVFKQHTGMTPREFSRIATKAVDNDAASKDKLRALLDQLSHVMRRFPGFFDLCRIVDPVENKAWMLHLPEQVKESSCYHFWSRKKPCERCVPYMAMNENRSFIKLDQGKGAPFLVLSIPVTLAEEKYVIEIFKSIENNFFDCRAGGCKEKTLPLELGT